MSWQCNHRGRMKSCDFIFPNTMTELFCSSCPVLVFTCHSNSFHFQDAQNRPQSKKNSCSDLYMEQDWWISFWDLYVIQNGQWNPKSLSSAMLMLHTLLSHLHFWSCWNKYTCLKENICFGYNTMHLWQRLTTELT